jgi:hypothetical protein
MLHGESPNVHESAVKNPKMLAGAFIEREMFLT